MLRKKLDNIVNPKKMPDGGYGGPFFGPTEDLLSSLFSGMQGSGLFNPKVGYTGSWQDNSKAIENDILGTDKTKYGTKDFFSSADAWAKETGQNFSGNPDKLFRAYNKSLQDRAGQKFDSTNANAKDFNAMLPMGMQLGQLFDLQQRENDEIQNKKLDIGDFSVRRSSYAPAGFSFNGGLISKYKQKPMAILRNGGNLFSNLPVGNYDQEVSGYVPLESLIPIQTEVDELIVLPTGDITKTNATKRHSKMSSDEVTDVVPEGSYILSKFGSVHIYKKDADQIIIEAENKPYNIYGQNKQPKVKTLGDIMTSKKMKPADLATIVMNKYKIIDNNDPFTTQTNAANKMTRAKYLQAIIGLSEYDKERQGINNDINVQMQELNPEMFAKDGGRVMRANYDVPKAVAPLLLAAIPSIISGVTSLISGIAAGKARKKAFNQGNNYINQFQTEGNQNIQGQLGSELFGFAMQDPNVKLARKSTDYLDAAYAGVPNQNFLAQQNALMAGEQDLSQLTPQQAVLYAGQMYANRADSMNKYRSQMNLYNSDLAVKKNLMLNDITNFNLNQTTNERNLTQQGRNQNFAGIASSLSGYYNNKTNMAANILNARQANLGQSTATFLANNQNNSQNVLNTAALALQGYNSYLGQTNPAPQVPQPPQGGGFGGGSGANFNNNGYNYFFPQYGGTGFNVMNAPTYQMKLGPQ